MDATEHSHDGQDLDSLISALVDGELTPQAQTAIIALLKREPALQERWALYHLVHEGLASASQDPELLKHALQLSARVKAAINNEDSVKAFDEQLIVRTGFEISENKRA